MEDTFRKKKIAMSFVMEFIGRNEQLPSGKKEGDLLNFVLNKIWEQKSAPATKLIDVDSLEIPTSTADGSQATKIETKGPNVCSLSCVFKGYVAFCLYVCPILIDPK